MIASAVMLSAAALGMAAYGLYSVAAALFDLIFRSRVEALADVGEVGFGLLLMLSAAFVRVTMPGGLALAIGALLGLQALSIHADVHLGGSVALPFQFLRAGVALLLVGLAFFGARMEREKARGRDLRR